MTKLRNAVTMKERLSANVEGFQMQYDKGISNSIGKKMKRFPKYPKTSLYLCFRMF
jgi:hypothetical protein